MQCVFRWEIDLYISFFPSVYPSVRRAPYLTNRAPCHQYFWYTCVRWWKLQPFFSFFKILIFWVVRGNKAKNGTKWQNIQSVALHISGSIHHIIVIYGHMCKMIISPGAFFSFSKFWFFGSSGEWKSKK